MFVFSFANVRIEIINRNNSNRFCKSFFSKTYNLSTIYISQRKCIKTNFCP